MPKEPEILVAPWETLGARRWRNRTPSSTRYAREHTLRSTNNMPRRREIEYRLSSKIWGGLPVLYSQVKVVPVRFLATILIALLFPLSSSMPAAKACSTPACCGANCPPSAPLNQVNCCKAPVAPDRAASQAQGAHHFDSISSMPVAGVIIAIAHLQNTLAVRGYSPPDRLASLALLCSRQI
jgi:hypothetical protein